MGYGTSNEPQHDIDTYLGACSTQKGMASGSQSLFLLVTGACPGQADGRTAHVEATRRWDLKVH